MLAFCNKKGQPLKRLAEQKEKIYTAALI